MVLKQLSRPTHCDATDALLDVVAEPGPSLAKLLARKAELTPEAWLSTWSGLSSRVGTVTPGAQRTKPALFRRCASHGGQPG
jgi:hypothetical protein